MKTHSKTPGNSFRNPLRLGWLLLIPLLATSLSAQTGPELTIGQSTNGTCLLTWPVTTNSHIVLSASNVAGPWQPCLNHLVEAAGTCCMTVEAASQCQYFRLVQGYYDDFEDGDLEGWMLYCMDPAFENIVSLDVTNGHLRVHGTWSGERLTYCLYTNVTLSNCVASMDILDWADDPQRLNCALATRFEPGIVTTNRSHYLGGASPRETDSPPESSIWIFKWYGVGGVSGGEESFPQMDPANDYRLVFRMVGGQASVKIYELTDLSTALETMNATDSSPLPSGWPGIFANDTSSFSTTLDVTLDNFVIYALP